jgi:hypothetical protein
MLRLLKLVSRSCQKGTEGWIAAKAAASAAATLSTWGCQRVLGAQTQGSTRGAPGAGGSRSAQLGMRRTPHTHTPHAPRTQTGAHQQLTVNVVCCATLLGSRRGAAAAAAAASYVPAGAAWPLEPAPGCCCCAGEAGLVASVVDFIY